MCCLVTTVLIPVTWSTDSKMWYPNISCFLDSISLLHGVLFSPSLHLISSLYLSCSCLWFFLSFQSVKKLSCCLLPIIKLLLNFILVDRANNSLWVSLFHHSETPFCDTFLQCFQHPSLHLPCYFASLSPPQPELHTVLQCQCRVYTGKITSLLLVTTQPIVYTAVILSCFSKHPGGTHVELHVLSEA